MSESALVDTDAYLVAQFTASMGSGSAYTTLKARGVYARALRDVQQWETWAAAGTIPVIVIECHDVRYSPGPHGGGVARMKAEYAYVVICLTQGDETDAERDAKILLKRAIKTLLSLRVNQTATDGEIIEGLCKPIAANVVLYPRPNANNKYYAYSAVGFVLEGIARE